jgi:hypothetical protein
VAKPLQHTWVEPDIWTSKQDVTYFNIQCCSTSLPEIDRSFHDRKRHQRKYLKLRGVMFTLIFLARINSFALIFFCSYGRQSPFWLVLVSESSNMIIWLVLALESYISRVLFFSRYKRNLG